MRKQDNENASSGKFDIRGAGGISDLAHNVFIISRNKLREQVKRLRDAGEALNEKELKILEQRDVYLSVEKNRNGSVENKHGLYFHAPSMQFTEREGRPLMRPF